MAFPQAPRLKTLGLKPGQPGTPQALASLQRTDCERIGAWLQAIGFDPE